MHLNAEDFLKSQNEKIPEKIVTPELEADAWSWT